MKNQICKLNFHYFGKTELDSFANGIDNGIFSNDTVFVTPPLTSSELVHIITDYSTALADYKAYGKIKKTAYLKAKEKLMNALDTLANYVNTIANGDPSIILLAGFVPTADTIQKSPDLSKIEVILVTPSKVNGQVFIETPAITDKGVTGYVLILVSGEPLHMDNFTNGVLNMDSSIEQKILIDFTKTRRKVVNNLDSSILYYGYMFAINPTSVSPLSTAFIVKCI